MSSKGKLTGRKDLSFLSLNFPLDFLDRRRFDMEGKKDAAVDKGDRRGGGKERKKE